MLKFASSFIKVRKVNFSLFTPFYHFAESVKSNINDETFQLVLKRLEQKFNEAKSI
jgi:hypothetical protein